jgi:hypothetical protein
MSSQPRAAERFDRSEPWQSIESLRNERPLYIERGAYQACIPETSIQAPCCSSPATELRPAGQQLHIPVDGFCEQPQQRCC